MSGYKAPVRDMKFAMTELFDSKSHYSTIPGGEEVDSEFIDAVLSEAARFCENEVAPLYEVGDDEGCALSEEGVIAPTGFKDAYSNTCDNGWISTTGNPEFGGQGLPESIGAAVNEFFQTANYSFAMYPMLSAGAVRTLEHHATPEQKAAYLPNLISGKWTGTMCLTEAHCGTDLGLLKTRAEPQKDGTYKITGTKIFISAGEHDLSENIVHVVLARLPGAPEGTKGISLFIVPRFKVGSDGSIGEPNAVTCGSVEKKMGIKGCPACVMNFDGSTGFLLGEENRGLQAMFVFMNGARMGVAMQGTAHAERAFQGALSYARERLQMRSLSGPKAPEKPADPIIVHPDVRRMLLTMKSFAEGGRALNTMMGRILDRIERGVEEPDDQDLLSFLTPIAKLFLTETGLEAASHGIQVFGGHGYIKEWGMEQNMRDARIATIYEGTTGIQALDLLGRKILMKQGKPLMLFTKILHQFCKEHADNADVSEFIQPLAEHNKEWGDLTQKVGMKAMSNPDEVGSASVDYGMYSGYVTLAYLWAKAAVVAQQKLKTNQGDTEFYKAKIETARFYFQRILPRTRMHSLSALAGAESLMAIKEEAFAF